METTPVQDLMADVSKYRFNPADIQRSVLRMLSETTNGDRSVVDPTNPFVFCLESAAVLTAGFMAEAYALTRQRYPLMAQTQEDLYLHMSDTDYLNRFARPATATFTFVFPKEKLINSLVLEPETGYRKITIPRNTYLTVAGMQFSLQYPIDIRQLAHQGLQIVYDNTKSSPLQTLEANEIDYDIKLSSDGEYVTFDVVATQFSVATLTGSINSATDLMMSVTLEDQFFYARAYSQNTSGEWIEMVTTHAAEIYDVAVPTAVFTLIDKVLQVKIPGVYVSSGMLVGKIRVDAYQTKGAINVPLGEYDTNSTTITWKALDNADKTIYTAPLSGISAFAYSSESVIDGANGMSFETLRKNVINNTTGPIDSSITPAQIETALVNKGYDVVKDVDNVTKRVFLATRSMPSPTLLTPTTAAATSTQLLTAAAASIETLSISTVDLVALPTVIDNGASITITPDTLYQIKDGITWPVSAAIIASLLALPPDQRALAVTHGNYLYTPVHYVMDTTNNAFELRPYYLDDPKMESKVFVRQNDTTLMQLGTGDFGVNRDATGYSITVVTKSDDTYKALPDDKVFAQLSYTPFGERDRAYLSGVLVGRTESNERIFTFDLATTFNVNADDNLELTAFTMYNNDYRITRSPLLNSFDVLYSTSETMTPLWRPNEIDLILGRHALPLQIAGITHETLKVRFGEALEMLWTRARTVVDSTPTQVWEMDVPAVYTQDIYVRDANGSAITIVDGQPVSTLLHAMGDPILNSEGDPVFLHQAGDPKFDGQGMPIPINPRGLVRQIDLLLIEGAYWFATDNTTTDYRKKLTASLVNWLVNDLVAFKGNLLDQTRIYFYPKTTSGVIRVVVGDGLKKSIVAGQAFSVTLAVSKAVAANSDLRERLSRVTVTTLSDMLLKPTLSVSEMTKALREAYGVDVIDVHLDGLGGTANYSVMSVVDKTARCSIRKRLVALADNSLIVEEDVTVQFVVHGVN